MRVTIRPNPPHASHARTHVGTTLSNWHPPARERSARARRRAHAQQRLRVLINRYTTRVCSRVGGLLLGLVSLGSLLLLHLTLGHLLLLALRQLCKQLLGRAQL